MMASRIALQTCQKSEAMPVFSKIIATAAPAFVRSTFATRTVARIAAIVVVAVAIASLNSCFQKLHTFQSLAQTLGIRCTSLVRCLLRSIAFATVGLSMLAFGLAEPFGPTSELTSALAFKPASPATVVVAIASSVDGLMSTPLAVEKAGMCLVPAKKSSTDRRQTARLIAVLHQLLTGLRLSELA